MRILFDQGTPAPLRKHLDGHEVDTVYEKGWSELVNGVLLKQTEDAGVDRRLRRVLNAGVKATRSVSQRSLVLMPMAAEFLACGGCVGHARSTNRCCSATRSRILICDNFRNGGMSPSVLPEASYLHAFSYALSPRTVLM